MRTTDANPFDKVRAQQERARERQRAKLADPTYQAKQREKQKAAADRAIQRRRELVASPEYQERQKVKQAEAQQRRQCAPKKPKKATSSPKKRAKGMPGRTPTADERRVMDAIGQLPCICCEMMGRYNPVISLHHTKGRTAPECHKYVLPLCAGHHDTPVPPEVLQQYPDMIPRHAKGSLGGPGAWRRLFGTEEALVQAVWERAGVSS